jgi:adenylate cyclase, class 2
MAEQPPKAPLQTPNEIEVKIRIPDLAACLERLTNSGLVIYEPRKFEANTLYDTPGGQLRNQEMLLRLREFGESYLITWKGPSVPGPHKNRPELQTSLGSAEILGIILTKLGFLPSFRYEKYRTEMRSQAEAGVVTVDETPIGNFLELEGPAEWIDAKAAALGFTPSDYILESYGRLYLADCERRGIEPSNMVFPPDSP